MGFPERSLRPLQHHEAAGPVKETPIMRMQLLTAFILAAVCVGCRVTSGAGGYTPPAKVADRAATQKYGDGILDALRDRNYRKLVGNIPGDLADNVSEPGFLASCDKIENQFGKLQNHRLLTALETPAFDNLIWVTDFSKTGANGKPIRRQLLFRVVTMQTDGKTKVVSFGFL